MDLKFYVCRHCGNIITKLNDSGVSMVCCGEQVSELIPGTVEASKEKHIPVFTVEGNVVTVNVGSIDHPMLPEHYIEWIIVQTNQGFQTKRLAPGDAPKATFVLSEGEKFEAVYEHCNLHGLWKAN